MIRTFLKNASTLAVIVFLWIVYSIGYLPLYQAMDVLTVVVFVTVMALTAEDVADKAFGNRKLMTWQYAILVAFVLTCDFLWVFLGSCDTWMQLLIRVLLLMAAAAGTGMWAWFAYRVSVMSDRERNILSKTIAYRKLARKFKKMNDEEVKTALESALFCHLEADSLEGRCMVGEPFTPEYKTLNELLAEDGGADNGAALSVINGYIQSLIEKRATEKKNKKK